MPKNIDDVVVPERRRSIRNISVSDVRTSTSNKLRGVKKEAESDEKYASHLPPPLPPRLRRKGPRRIFWALILAGLIFVFTTMSLLSGATLSYVPRSASVAFSGESFSAYKSGDALIYSVVKLSGDKGVEVPATGEKDVTRKASGTIIIYNNSNAAQELIATTRFESSQGKVYRISKGVNVPANGLVEAGVTADQAGSEYNIDLTDFTLPGLKGTPKFQTIYARSKSVISGGFVGKEKSVEPVILTKAKEDLKATLSQELLIRAKAEVPVEFILFSPLSSISFEDLLQSESTESGGVTINLRGNLYGVMFKRSELSRALALSKLELALTEEVEIANLDSLEVSFAGITPADILTLSKIDFKVNGSAKVLWKTDETLLARDLLGRKKSEVLELLKNYPSIKDASVTLYPFWHTAFPDDVGKITLKKLKDE